MQRALQSRISKMLAISFLLLASLVASARADTYVLASAVDSVDMTVSGMDLAVDFYSRVLSFKKVWDTEVAGETYENLEGVFGVRMRVVRMQLGDEFIELTEYLTPKGPSITAGAHCNDRSFQHIAIIVSDMDKAYAWLHQYKVEHASSGPQRLPDWNRNASGIKAFYFKDPDGHPLEILQYRRIRELKNGTGCRTSPSLGLITPRLWWATQKQACAFIAIYWVCGSLVKVKTMAASRNI